MKVTVVGGGSTYTPELADGIARLQRLFGVDELVLTDPAEKRLKLVAGISQRIFARDGYSGHISSLLILIGRCQMRPWFCSSSGSVAKRHARSMKACP
jgi:hypothetical protein